jgi:hypothetical protein
MANTPKNPLANFLTLLFKLTVDLSALSNAFLPVNDILLLMRGKDYRLYVIIIWLFSSIR